MINFDNYVVYENETNTIVAEGGFADVEKFLDENSKSIEGYSVVWVVSGYTL